MSWQLIIHTWNSQELVRAFWGHKVYLAVNFYVGGVSLGSFLQFLCWAPALFKLRSNLPQQHVVCNQISTIYSMWMSVSFVPKANKTHRKLALLQGQSITGTVSLQISLNKDQQKIFKSKMHLRVPCLNTDSTFSLWTVKHICSCTYPNFTRFNTCTYLHISGNGPMAYDD